MTRRPVLPAVLVAGAFVLIAIVALATWLPGPRAGLPVPSASAEPTTDGSAEPAASPAASTVARSPVGLPDPRRTPGSINPNVTQANIGSTICHKGWTSTIRPPSAYTNALKLVQILEYGYTDRKSADYQEDHLVPLELGGAPRDPANLWPEPNVIMLADGTSVGSNAKDGLENNLRARVCAGSIPLADAQRLIAGDWISAWLAAGRP